MLRERVVYSCLATMLLAGWLAGPTWAQPVPVPSRVDPYTLDSGPRDNPTDAPAVVFDGVVAGSFDTPWVRVLFSEARLPEGSYLRMTSLGDRDVQTLNGRQIVEWQYGSCFFNGWGVAVELVAGPRTKGNSFRVSHVVVGVRTGGTTTAICGVNDDRAPSNDARVGRLLITATSRDPRVTSGCTGWIINIPTNDPEKCHLSAGHCFTAPAMTILQFDVPASAANCFLNHPPATEQFAVRQPTIFRDNGEGDDWAVFKCSRNPVTQRTTFQEQGAAFTLANMVPGMGTVRVTGFGVDGNENAAGGGNAACSCNPDTNMTGTRNQTQQTHTGPLVAGVAGAIGHQVDTCGANSGSPIILESSGEAIGIHTHGGCELARAHNGGTRIDDARLQDGIRRCAAECFLVGGVAPTAIPLGGADTLYVFFVSADTWWPVTMNDIPVFPIPNNPGLVGLSGYFQVLMYNPVDYPNDPLKSSNGLQATIGIGTQAYGREEGMRLWAPAPPMPGQPFTVAFIVQ